MIRFAEARDTLAVRALFDLCFPDESGFNAYFFDHLYRPEQTLLYEQTDKLCAMLQMLPYQLSLNGTAGEATYIYGACTHPAHRRKHLMAQLLEASFQEDLRRGRVASMLIPQEEWLFDFYRPFGYLPAFTLERQIALQGAAPNIDMRRLKNWYETDKLYRHKTCQSACFILRSEDNWKEQFQLFDALGAGAFGLYEGGELAAYAFVWQEETGLFAQELIAKDSIFQEQLAQALMHRFDKHKFVYDTVGDGRALGCLKPYQPASVCGYINLMFN